MARTNDVLSAIVQHATEVQGHLGEATSDITACTTVPVAENGERIILTREYDENVRECDRESF